MKDMVKKYAPIAAPVIAALGLILFLAMNAITVEMSAMGMTISDSAKGWDVMTGGENGKFAFMVFVTVLLAVGGIVCSVLSYLGKGEIFALIATACYALAAIFFFCTVGFYCSANDVSKSDIEKVGGSIKLAAGAVLAAILMILAAACAIAPKAMDKFLK